MKNTKTTIVAGIGLLALIFAFKNIPDQKESKVASKQKPQKATGQSACEAKNGRAALLAHKVTSSKYDLGSLLSKGGLVPVNREVVSSEDKSHSAVKIKEKEGEGVVWIKGVKFSKGTIDVDLKGKDVLQKSFIGIAFHGADDKTFDGIYFRPFNFKTPDSVRHIHAVQYISHPDFPWKKLRDEKNGQYEKAVTPEPDPNNWFHARIEVGDKEVKVYVNNATKSSLVVNKLNDRKTGTIGLWTGEGSGGEFANLTITSND
ncbi:family 16 glycoside hydrolase [Sporocytophaga myxococcoides]|uniref:family 16 glycoside hydrolase n=1 Tax=Sporocytophaga myxococcoides TaxID=153721 RepID=UPI0004231C31|nr:family 16 glycoside hydrolase [Sporocytophaga myxococcoides]